MSNIYSAFRYTFLTLDQISLRTLRMCVCVCVWDSLGAQGRAPLLLHGGKAQPAVWVTAHLRESPPFASAHTEPWRTISPYPELPDEKGQERDKVSKQDKKPPKTSTCHILIWMGTFRERNEQAWKCCIYWWCGNPYLLWLKHCQLIS